VQTVFSLKKGLDLGLGLIYEGLRSKTTLLSERSELNICVICEIETQTHIYAHLLLVNYFLNILSTCFYLNIEMYVLPRVIQHLFTLDTTPCYTRYNTILHKIQHLFTHDTTPFKFTSLIFGVNIYKSI